MGEVRPARRLVGGVGGLRCNPARRHPPLPGGGGIAPRSDDRGVGGRSRVGRRSRRRAGRSTVRPRHGPGRRIEGIPLQTDLIGGRRMEIDALQGVTVRLGRELGVPTPNMTARPLSRGDQNAGGAHRLADVEHRRGPTVSPTGLLLCAHDRDRRRNAHVPPLHRRRVVRLDLRRDVREPQPGRHARRRRAVPAGTAADAAMAVRAAEMALPRWKATPAPKRGEILYAFGALMAAAQGAPRPGDDARDGQGPGRGARRRPGRASTSPT